jgi:hypothetical protein
MDRQSESDEDDPAFEALGRCCSAIVVLFAYSVDVVQLAVINGIAASDVVELDSVLETAELRADDSPGIAERIRIGLRLLRQIAPSE